MKLKTHTLEITIPEQTRKIDVDVDDPTPYVTGYLDGTIYASGDCRPDPLHEVLDGLTFTATVIEPKHKFFDVDAVLSEKAAQQRSDELKKKRLEEATAEARELRDQHVAELRPELEALGLAIRTSEGGNGTFIWSLYNPSGPHNNSYASYYATAEYKIARTYKGVFTNSSPFEELADLSDELNKDVRFYLGLQVK